MKVLIIEDDEFKAEKLELFFKNLFPDVYIEIVVSLADATEAIDNDLFDLIMVDMGIPSHPAEQGEGAPMSLLTGGIDIIIELSLMGRSDKCIVITQYPSIEICGEHYLVKNASVKFKELLECDVLACIHYVEDDNKWMSDLESAIGIGDENFNIRR